MKMVWASRALSPLSYTPLAQMPPFPQSGVFGVGEVWMCLITLPLRALSPLGSSMNQRTQQTT